MKNKNDDNSSNKSKNRSKQSRTIYLMMMNHKIKGRLNSKSRNRKRNGNNNKEALVKNKEEGLQTLEKHCFPHSYAIILWEGQNNNNQAGFGFKIYILILRSTRLGWRSTSFWLASFRLKIFLFCFDSASCCSEKRFCIYGLSLRSTWFRLKIYIPSVLQSGVFFCQIRKIYILF